MEYKSFLRQLQKQGSKPHRISHCYGVRDAWKWVRKNQWKALKGTHCSSSTYGAIINLTNKLLVEMLFEGHRIPLPYRMGTLELIATPASIKSLGGEVKSNYRTDWKKTLEYWHEDKEALQQRKRIKRVQKFIYSFYYSKHTAAYRNQRYYQFRVNRSLVRLLGEKIENEKLNALIY